MKKVIIPVLLLTLTGCGKNFLTQQPSTTYATPQTLNDLEKALKSALLLAETPVLGEQSADDYYLTTKSFETSLLQDKNIYTWQKDIFAGQKNIPDWNLPYTQINECNRVLREINLMSPTTALRDQYNEIIAAALFIRSYEFYNLLQIFAAVYDSSKASQQLGISIPLKDSLSVFPPRSSMKESYDRIIQDILNAIPWLSIKVSKDRDYPSRPAAFALLARIYLNMSDYSKAGMYADSCLKYNAALIDYNNLDLKKKFPVDAKNEEVLFQSWLITTSNIIQGRVFQGTIIDSTLYRTYDSADIRKEAFFLLNADKLPIFRSNYNGNAHAFSGLAVDEIYLIRAECYARNDSVSLAMADLNHLIETRYKRGTYQPYVAHSKKDALAFILKERRKELVFRGLRWSDIRRLNKEEANIILSRFIRDSMYLLPPKSPNFALPIPDDALLNGIIIQNDRK